MTNWIQIAFAAPFLVCLWLLVAILCFVVFYCFARMILILWEVWHDPS